MIREIVQNPNKALRAKSSKVLKAEFESSELKKILTDMSDTLKEESDGVALAAPQIAINKRIFVVSGKVFDTGNPNDASYTQHDDIVFINPEITKISRDRKLMHEGCLSVRPLYGDIRRASRVTVTAQNFSGEYFEMTGTGLLAEIFQHEIDHLDGILFIDNAINIKDGEVRTLDKQKKQK